MNLCWWCCHEIPGEVYHFPYKYEKEQFYTCGQFCSWPCVKAYNLAHSGYRTGTACDTITLYRKRIYNEVKPLKAAPSRYTLKSFGGKLTIEEFRSGNTEAWIRLPNEYFQVQNVEVKQKESTGDTELVLTRNKPLKRDSSAIHKMIIKK